MTVSPDVTIGQLIPLLALVVGAIGGWFTLRYSSADTARKTDALSAKVEAAERSLAEHRMEVVRDYVRRNDLREVKEELVASIQEIKATVRDAITQALGGRRGGPQS